MVTDKAHSLHVIAFMTPCLVYIKQMAVC